MKQNNKLRSAVGRGPGWQALTVGLVGVGLCLPGASRAAESDARPLVMEMATQARKQNYDGTFVYIRGSHAASMRIIHKVDGQGERERLIALNGSAKEVVRRNGETTCFFPGERSVMVDKSRSSKVMASSFPQRINKVSENYQYVILGGDRVVARPTWVVKIWPNDNDRYGYRLWIDSGSHLMLKSEVLDAQGATLEQVLFTSISFPKSIPESELKSAVDGQDFAWHRLEEPAGDSHSGTVRDGPVWSAQWLPGGFMLHERRKHAMRPGGEPVEQHIYSDGIASVSVFVEKSPGNEAKADEVSTFGATNTFSTITEMHQVTVVGELPIDVLKRIAASVAPSAQSK